MDYAVEIQGESRTAENRGTAEAMAAWLAGWNLRNNSFVSAYRIEEDGDWTPVDYRTTSESGSEPLQQDIERPRDPVWDAAIAAQRALHAPRVAA